MCRLDKGNGVCIINTKDYVQKLDSIVYDKSKFEEVNYDPYKKCLSNCNSAPWTKSENSIKYYLRTYFNKTVDSGTYKWLTPTGSAPGKLYGLAKVHKKDCPLRPVNCMIGTPEYQMAKFIDSKIKPYIPSEYTVNSTEAFINKLRSYKVTDGDICVSFDVKSLFTNVPRSYTIDKICTFFDQNLGGVFLQGTDKDGKVTTVYSNILKKLLHKCTKGHFMYNNKVFTQIDGVQMGSPLGPTIANWFLGDIEKNIFVNHQNFFPKMYTRYVDDVFAIFKRKDDVHKFLDVLNNQHKNLEFTVEWPKGTLPFLDVEVSLRDTIETWLYRKPTNTNVVLNFDSVAPRAWKTGLIKCLFQRAKVVCSSKFLLMKELNNITERFKMNGYPEWFVLREKDKFLNENKKKITPDEEGSEKAKTCILVFPFIGKDSVKLAQRMRKIFENTFGIDVKVAYRNFKVGNYFGIK